MWIDRGSPFPQTLERVEHIARSKGWQGQLAKLVPAPQQPQSGSLPVCPLCGGELVRKTGTSQRGKHYDFYGCKNFARTRCKGSMEVKDYNKAVHGSKPVPIKGTVKSGVPAGGQPLSKAAQAARKKANGVKKKQPVVPEPEETVDETPAEELEVAQEQEREKKAKEAFEDRKKGAYWKM